MPCTKRFAGCGNKKLALMISRRMYFGRWRNAAIDQLRRHPMPDELLPDFIFDPGQPPDQLAETAEFKQQVVERLLTLSGDERETIVQHLYGELTFQQIADIRGTAPGTVTSWYRRGLEKLRGKLEVVDGSV